MESGTEIAGLREWREFSFREKVFFFYAMIYTACIQHNIFPGFQGAHEHYGFFLRARFGADGSRAGVTANQTT